MHLASRPTTFLFLEVGNLLGILNFGESPLGVDLPASVGAAMLCSMAAVILVVTASRRLQRWLPWVEGWVGTALIVTAGSTLVVSQQSASRMIGLAICGGFFVASAVARHRRARGEQEPAM